MNALLDDWTTPFGLPPFGQFDDAAVMPAVDAAMAEARARIATIAEAEAPADFANTIAALELADESLGRVLGAFFTLAATDATPAREALQRELSPKLSAFFSEVVMNRALFGRIEDLWARRDTLGLGAEDARVLFLTRRRFLRAGAALEGVARDRLVAIRAELASLSTQFAQNVLADERAWSLAVPPDVLAALPGFLQDGLRAAGTARGAEGPVVTLARSLIVPFLQYCPDRELRREAQAAWAARGTLPGETDNRAIAARMLSLRAELAELLGAASYARFNLETEMAGTPDRVRGLLDTVWAPARAQAEADGARLAEMAREDGVNGPLAAWDWRYYAERRRQAEHAFDEAALKPYLQLDRMIAAAQSVAGRLFGLEFAPVQATLHHPTARAWEVTRDGRHMALFVGDFFARDGKRSGAWCSTMRSQRKLGGEVRPIVVNVCNFAAPPEGQPALLSIDDARTLFHEFGHALHHILSDVTYPSISGTSVARDFVELPSQLYEHWLDVPEVLAEFATHAETGAPMPADLRAKLEAARNFDQGFSTVEYTASALVDLALHDGPPPADVIAREAEILAEIGLPAAIPPRHAAAHFAHIFAGGYASGYYSYLWSEVMDADAFEAFEEAGGPFDAGRAAALERHILSAGGRAEAEELYTAFRGRMPDAAALLRGRGLDAA